MSLRYKAGFLVAFALVCARSAHAEDRRPIAEMVARVLPTVVSIQTFRATPEKSGNRALANATPDVQRADGSGFIVEPGGFIATNRHVVEGSYKIAVTLADGRTVLAKVIWKSPVVDIAFLKIDVDGALPVVSFASEGDLKLGERVVAIGNPFGLGISVSSGVVSGLNRNIKQSPYDDFIQTDAAINHGNSGGPLFDRAGKVVGMNSVLWQSGKEGGFEGVGFAIPGSDLTFLIDQLKRNKTVHCGWLGLHGQKLTHAMADALGYPDAYGVIVATVEADSPAAKAAVRPGDVIKTFDGKVLYDITTLNRSVCPAIGKTVALNIWRDGHFTTIDPEIVEGKEATGPDESHVAAPRFASARDYGLTLAPITDAIRRRYRLPKTANGLAVTAVSSSGVADDAGLSAGDVITSLQMTPVSAGTPFDETLVGYGRKGLHHVIIMVQSTGGPRWITLPVNL